MKARLDDGIVPASSASGENARAHRVPVGRAGIGAAWTKTSNEGREDLGLKPDDPSFAAPIYANLVDDEDGEGRSLIWSRPNRRRGDGSCTSKGPGRKTGAERRRCFAISAIADRTAVNGLSIG
jgi:uncharacterized protein (DUF736 family)